MKKISVVLVVVLSLCLVASMALAAEAKKGTVKGVDAKAGTMTVCYEGTNADVTLKAGKGVDLTKVKAGEKVELMVEKDMAESVKAGAAAKPKASVGC